MCSYRPKNKFEFYFKAIGEFLYLIALFIDSRFYHRLFSLSIIYRKLYMV